MADPNGERSPIAWESGRWTTHPTAARQRAGKAGPELYVQPGPYSDAWRTTSYGFVHDNENALVVPFEHGTSVEVVVTARFEAQFDQAGLFLTAGPERWVKAGLELSDGVLQVGAVVTHGTSDWSVAPVPQWLGRDVRVRASWGGDAVTIRAGLNATGEPLNLVRVLHWDPDLITEAGPYACTPTRGADDPLVVRFIEWSMGTADRELHG